MESFLEKSAIYWNSAFWLDDLSCQLDKSSWGEGCFEGGELELSERIHFSCSSGSSPSFYFTFLPTRYVCTYPRVCPSARNEKQVATSAAFVGAISPLLTLLPACTTRVSEGEELESSERIFFSCSSSSSPSFYLKILPTRYVWDSRNSGHFHHIFPDQSLEQRKNCASLQKKVGPAKFSCWQKIGWIYFCQHF